MREVNFSIPNGNKASVHITATLYDRRALDCTSTLPLINSLNHLAYLTTSSARIRDILTVDGGVERLVCILKEGRSKEEMHMWKWNLAFQCVVNIGVRGTEPVRTRVVEADMVPVIATILHDYILVVERDRQKVDGEKHRNPAKIKSNGPRSARLPRDLAHEQATHTSFLEHQMTNSDNRHARRQAPPPSLEIAQSFTDRFNAGESSQTIPPPPPTASAVFTSPPERTTFARPNLQHHNRSHDGRNHRNINAGPTTGVPSAGNGEAFSLRPVQDSDRLPSMVAPLHSGITSNPESPRTPLAPMTQRGILSPTGRRLRRPSIRHQLSTGDDVDMQDVNTLVEETIIEQEARDRRGRDRNEDGELTPRAVPEEEEPDPLSLTIPGTLPPEQDNVDIAQQTPTAATALEALLNPPQDTNGNSPAVNGQQPIPSPVVPLNPYSSLYLRTPNSNNTIMPLMPRDDDVLMGLQLLAYISKYCDLRHYFQATHLVPRLRIDREVEKVYGPIGEPLAEPTEDEMEEYLQPDNVNIFPLVEKFTVPHHSKDMQYWACVVMRNLCRKDDARGGTRQCANYKCGKWEEYPRQFAKCRRCKRTKYCSKDCQRDSWSMHRHWCQLTPQSTTQPLGP